MSIQALMILLAATFLLATPVHMFLTIKARGWLAVSINGFLLLNAMVGSVVFVWVALSIA